MSPARSPGLQALKPSGHAITFPRNQLQPSMDTKTPQLPTPITAKPILFSLGIQHWEQNWVLTEMMDLIFLQCKQETQEKLCSWYHNREYQRHVIIGPDDECGAGWRRSGWRCSTDVFTVLTRCSLEGDIPCHSMRSSPTSSPLIGPHSLHIPLAQLWRRKTVTGMTCVPPPQQVVQEGLRRSRCLGAQEQVSGIPGTMCVVDTPQGSWIHGVGP